MGKFVKGGKAIVAGMRYAARMKRWTSFKTLANNVMWLKRLVNVEIKKYDANVAAASVPSTGTVYPLHEIAQGDTDQQRNGLSIKPLTILIKYTCLNNATAVTTNTRVLLVKDLQQVADTNPAVGDILDGSVAPLYQAPLNNASVGRFKILKDFNIILDNARSNRKDGKIFAKLFGHIRYNGVNATDIQKNGYYLVLVSDQPTNAPLFLFNERLSYADN